MINSKKSDTLRTQSAEDGITSLNIILDDNDFRIKESKQVNPVRY